MSAPNQISQRHAVIIAELLVNAGYIDAPQGMLQDYLNSVGIDDTKQVASDIDDLIASVNLVLPTEQQVKPTHTMLEVVNQLIGD
jgi:hypothetical protein